LIFEELLIHLLSNESGLTGNGGDLIRFFHLRYIPKHAILAGLTYSY